MLVKALSAITHLYNSTGGGHTGDTAGPWAAIKAGRAKRGLRSDGWCLLLIMGSFLLTSSGYLSWLHHLLKILPARAVDMVSMGAGYLMQGMGIGLFCWFIRRERENEKERNAGILRRERTVYIAAAAVFMACLAPAMLSPGTAGTIIFGLLMNLACGVMAGFYLYALSIWTDPAHRAMVFGLGYGVSVLASWLLSLAGPGFLHSGYAVLVYLAMTAGLIWLVWFPADMADGSMDAEQMTAAGANENRLAADVTGNVTGNEGRAAGQAADATGTGAKAAGRPVPGEAVYLTCVTVFLMCLVKNLGASFPASDLKSGVSLELSRLLYAVSLAAAGYVNDRNRKYGAICTLAALVTPFIMLSLSGEPLPHMVLWCLDYLIYGFFAVYRVIVFSDMAQRNTAWHLAPFGLMLGRFGDAAGTAIHSLLKGHMVVLILLAALLFAATVFLFFRLYQALYIPAVREKRSEREIFEHFAIRHDLSAREREVLTLLLTGATNAEISQKLFVSESTVKFHVHNLLQKTGCQSRSQLRTAYVRSADPDQF